MKDQLIHMRDKLNDISRRNRSIRLLKLYNKWSFDLTELDQLSDEKVSETIIEKIINQTKNEITLLKPTINNKDSMEISKKLTDLTRNLRGIEEETGIHDFYLGFPFLSGTLSDGTFFQAPLFLYPVRLEKNNLNSQKWVLKLEEGGLQINRTLFLAIKKLNNLSFTEDFFEQAAEAAGKYNYEEWLSFLKGFEINVSFTAQGITPLKEYKKEDIPEVANFALLEHAIIGNFPQGGSSLVKDYDELIERSEESDLSLAGELIAPQDTVIDTLEDTETIETDNTNQNLDILNLLQADGSQEEILKEARFKKGLVVHGPPGTGKSQVIVNLITDAINQDKRVLVVCQKRAALDVVYQRLDSLGLSNHVALVQDEKQDRKKLYTKLESVLNQNQISFEQAINSLSSTSKKLASQEDLLNSIAKALYEYQDFGLRLYDLYGKATTVEDSSQIIDLNEVLSKMNKDLLDDVCESVYTYAEWFERFGDEDYPLRTRKHFAALNMKDKLEAVELLNDLIDKAKNSCNFINSLDHEKITPGYTWLIENKLDKISLDLNDGNKRTLQGLRLWWWTSFSGKSIIEELLEGKKFKGTSSPEWLKVKKSLVLMHQLGKETKKMAEEIDKLKRFIDDATIDAFKNRISEGDIPFHELDKMVEFIHRDFEDLQQMDAYWNHCSEVVKKVIILLQNKKPKNESSLPEYWADLVRNSAYVQWIDQTERKYPQVQKISTSEFSRIRESFAKLIEEKRKFATQFLIYKLSKNVESVQTIRTKVVRELKHQAGKKRKVCRCEN
ncbi:DUF4011 domain-containing protein [Neobacillus pocheonensis]|uniref:DUF4011 domain-containing protein n=1 Tax=Neobacillus pocheonensis TaxID=363869 RepID=A0ABT0W8X9_9BACI|nr:DUF4011 domain-containing protein [Neobacillus pocheonensis]